jgi:uncharacterized protein (TIGR00251 family)
MRISARVKPGASTERIEKLNNGGLSIRVKAPAKENKANEAAIAALSRFFGVSKTRVKLVIGSTSRNKIFDIDL